jgi:hypothetical protein
MRHYDIYAEKFIRMRHYDTRHSGRNTTLMTYAVFGRATFMHATCHQRIINSLACIGWLWVKRTSLQYCSIVNYLVSSANYFYPHRIAMSETGAYQSYSIIRLMPSHAHKHYTGRIRQAVISCINYNC